MPATMTDATISDIGDAYLEFRAIRAAKTREMDKSGIAVLLSLGPTLVSELTLADVRKHVVRRIEGGASPRTINIEVGAAKRMLAWAVAEKMCESNPLARWEKLPDHGVRERRKFTPAEARDLLDRVADAWLPLMQLYACTGMRRCEASELEWSEVRLDRAIIRLPAGRTKTDEPRNVVLGPRMVAMLRGLPHTGKFVFPNPTTGKPYNIGMAGTEMKSAAKRAGWSDLSGVSPQTWRRTFANDVYQRTHDTVLVDTLLGHRGDLNKQCYVEAKEADLREQAEKVERVMLGEEA